jgi:hypothetical protein
VGVDPDLKPIKENKFPYPPNVLEILEADSPLSNSCVTGCAENSDNKAAFFC